MTFFEAYGKATWLSTPLLDIMQQVILIYRYKNMIKINEMICQKTDWKSVVYRLRLSLFDHQDNKVKR